MYIAEMLYWIETEASAEDLKRIATAYRYRQDTLARNAVWNWRVGDAARFWSKRDGGRWVVGTITKVNQKNVKFLATDGTKWTVAAVLLQAPPTKTEG